MNSERWAIVQALFDEALAQPPDGRDAWLATACQGDAALAALVRRLLDADSRENTDLDDAVSYAVGDLLTPITARRLGPYRVVSEIGRGGMGTVYLAERDDHQFEQRVAIKVIRGWIDGDRLRRFRAERQILATLDHPNIARLLDGGTTDEGWPYLVMEYVDGVPIDRYVRDRQLEVPARLAVFLTICRAVSHAHRHLVVHRDLKPGNILVTPDGTPKLLDFGIAKLLGAEADDSAAATLTGMRLLTPDYAAPEQVRGDRITTATDVYALGALLFELLTGSRPFALGSRSARDIERIICDTEPPRPGSRASLDPDLDVIVLTALQKDPARRYVSVDALADDVRHYLDGVPIQARPSTWRYRTGRFVSRHRWVVAAAAVLLLMLTSFAIVASIQAARIAAERDAAQRERDTAAEVSDFLVELFEVSDPGESRGNSVTARELLDRGAARIATELAGEPAVQSRLMETIGRVYRSLGLFEPAGTAIAQALAVRERHGGRQGAAVANTIAELAEVSRERGQFAAAERLHREALDMRQAAFGAATSEVAHSLNGLGLVLSAQGKYQDAEPRLREAIAIWRRTLPPADPQLAVALNNLQILLRRTSRLQEAEAMAREALEIRRHALPAPHPLLANSVMQLGQVLQDQGRLDDAERLMRESLAMRLQLHDALHPAVAVSYNNLAALLHDKGDLAGAEPMYREAVKAGAARFGTSHPEYAVNLNNLASLLEDRGVLGDAEAMFRQALAIRQQALGNDHPAVARGMNNLARVLAQRLQFGEADALATRSLAMRRRLLGEKTVDVASGLGTLGLLRAKQRRFDEAATLHEQQLALLRALLPADHPSIASALVSLGSSLRDAGRTQAAEPLLREALAIRQKKLPPGHWQTAYAECALARLPRTEGAASSSRVLTDPCQNVPK